MPVPAKQVDDQPYRYAYLTRDTDGSTRINVVNPSEPDDAPWQMKLLVDSTDVIINTDSSPNGSRIVVFIAEQDYSAAYYVLVNLTTLSSLRTDDFYVGVPEYADFQWHRAWSPDSQLFAYIAASTDGSGSNLSRAPSLWLYDARLDHSAVMIEPDIQLSPQVKIDMPYYLSWSGDSQFLAILSIRCIWDQPIQSIEGCEPSRIQVVSADTGELLAARSLGMWPGPDLPREVCGMVWSPDGTRIAFEFVCSFAAVAYRDLYFDEIFVWDIESDQLTQVTANTNPLVDVRDIMTISNPNPSWDVRYELAFENSQRLLVGTRGSQYVTGAGYVPASSLHNLTVYDLESGNSTRIFDRFPAYLATNPEHDKIAFRAESSEFFSSENGITNIRLPGEDLYITDTAGHILHREPTDSTSQWSIGELRWSPDGRWLGYTVNEMTTNTYGVEFWSPGQLKLVNAENGQVILFEPPASAELLDVVGWTIEPMPLDLPK